MTALTLQPRGTIPAHLVLDHLHVATTFQRVRCILLELDRSRGRALVKPLDPADAPPIEVGLSQFRPDQVLPPYPVRPVARLEPLALPEAAPAPQLMRVGLVLVDRTYAPIVPLPKPGGRYIDEEYLAAVRLHSCLGCGGEQRTQTEADHFGPRAVGRKTHDLFTNPLCGGPPGCHRYRHWHGHLPGLSRLQTVTLLYSWQLWHLPHYFGAQLGPDAERWTQLGAAADTPAELRIVLDLLFHRLTGRAV